MKNKNYRSISEVSEILKIKQHVIRYWDSKFEGISTRLNKTKRRYFNSQNIKKLQTLKELLHTNGKPHYSLEMANNILKKNILKKDFDLSIINSNKALNIEKLAYISNNLKKLIE